MFGVDAQKSQLINGPKGPNGRKAFNDLFRLDRWSD